MSINLDPLLEQHTSNGTYNNSHNGRTTTDQTGEFMWLDKRILNVDMTYQRERTNKKTLVDMAKKWSWTACGALTIIKRLDGTYWIDDGQGRKLAADMRKDIPTLPCMVFISQSSKPIEEAASFLEINSKRSILKTLDRFKARIASEDPLALAIRDMVEASGYHLAYGKDRKTVGCVGALSQAMKTRSHVARRVWDLCVDLHRGDRISEDIYFGLFALEIELSGRKSSDVESIFQKHNLDGLRRLGVVGLKEYINACKVYKKGKGGERTNAQGILDGLNKGRSKRRIPDINFWRGKDASQ